MVPPPAAAAAKPGDLAFPESNRLAAWQGCSPHSASTRSPGREIGFAAMTGLPSTSGGPPTSEAAVLELARLRDSIDNLDAALVHVLAERFKCTQQVGVLKARSSMPPADPEREAHQIDRLRRLAAEAKLDPEFAEKFLSFIIAEVLRHHEAITEV